MQGFLSGLRLLLFIVYESQKYILSFRWISKLHCNLCLNLSVIVISETLISDDTIDFYSIQFCNHEYISKGYTGVWYLFSLELHNIQSKMMSVNNECIFVKLSDMRLSTGKNITIGVVERPLNISIKTFNEILKDVLCKLGPCQNLFKSLGILILTYLIVRFINPIWHFYGSCFHILDYLWVTVQPGKHLTPIW